MRIALLHPIGSGQNKTFEEPFSHRRTALLLLPCRDATISLALSSFLMRSDCRSIHTPVYGASHSVSTGPMLAH
jgi:hypothetical protein